MRLYVLEQNPKTLNAIHYLLLFLYKTRKDTVALKQKYVFTRFIQFFYRINGDRPPLNGKGIPDGLNICATGGRGVNARALLAITAFLVSRLAVAIVLPSLNGAGIAGYSFRLGK